MDTPATTETPTLQDAHRACFACGASNRGGLHLCFECDASGVAAAEWQPTAAFLSYADRVHGGVIATLLDSSMVHATAGQAGAIHDEHSADDRADHPLQNRRSEPLFPHTRHDFDTKACAEASRHHRAEKGANQEQHAIVPLRHMFRPVGIGPDFLPTHEGRSTGPRRLRQRGGDPQRFVRQRENRHAQYADARPNKVRIPASDEWRIAGLCIVPGCII